MTRKWWHWLLLLLTLGMAGDLLVRGVGAALQACRNDFSDPYFAATLFRQGLNPYDRTLATALSIRAADCHVPVVPLYPPTAYVLFTPLTLLPWIWANVLWALLTVAGVGIVAWVLVTLGGFRVGSDQFWITIAAVFAFAPMHTAMHAANVAVIVLAVALLGVLAASRNWDIPAGILLAIAMCLKPQFGAWFLIYYLVRWRWRIIGSAALTGGTLSAIALSVIPLTFAKLLSNYSANVAYWFGPGGQNDFTAANPLHYQLFNLQVLLHPAIGDAHTTNLVTLGLFLTGLGVWGYAMFRRKQVETLAIASLLALSALPFYHRSYEAGAFLLLLVWALTRLAEVRCREALFAGLALIPFLLPGQVLLSRITPHLASGVFASWWWVFVVAPYQVWALVALNLILLAAMLGSERLESPSPGRVEA